MTLRVGLVGLGWFGDLHRQVWQADPSVELVSVCDLNHARLRSPGTAEPQADFHETAHGIGNLGKRSSDPSSYTDVEEMLSTERLDFLDVVTPEATHERVASLGFDHGLHVAVEKPMALSARSAHRLRAKATKAGRQLFVGHILRFDPRYQALVGTLRKRDATVRHMSFQRHFQVAAHHVYGRVSPFLGACIHDIDLAIWITGRKPARVLGVTEYWLGEEHPDVALAILEWEDGLRAVVQNVWHVAKSCPYGFSFDTLVLADDLTLRITNQPDLEVWGPSAVKLPESFLWPLVSGGPKGALSEELRHFARSAEANEPSSVVDLDEAVMSIEVAEALLRSATVGAWQTP